MSRRVERVRPGGCLQCVRVANTEKMPIIYLAENTATQRIRHGMRKEMLAGMSKHDMALVAAQYSLTAVGVCRCLY